MTGTLRRIVVLALMLTACNNPFRKDNPNTDPLPDFKPRLEALRAQADLYCEQSLPLYRERGWVHSECDGVIFTNLYAVACPQNQVDTSVFEYPDQPGRYSRDPQPEECFSKNAEREAAENPNRSPTTDSRDGLNARMIRWWQTEDVAAVTRAIDYLRAHDWYLCPKDGAKDDGVRFSRCFVNPAAKATLYELGAFLGYPCDAACKEARAVPQVFDPKDTGFELHLEVISTLLRGTMQGVINDNQRLMLKSAASRNPGNVLYQAAATRFDDGNFQTTVEAAENQALFPKDHLPTTENYCTEYLFQRDERENGQTSSDWLPCPERQEPKSGTDFSFAIKVFDGLRRPSEHSSD